MGIAPQFVDQGGFFGQTAQFAVASAAPIQLTEVIVAVEETKTSGLNLACGQDDQQGEKEARESIQLISWMDCVHCGVAAV